MPIRIDIIPMKIVENSPEAIAIDKSLMNIMCIYFMGKAKNYQHILDIHKEHLPKGDNPIKERKDYFRFYFEHMTKFKIKDCMNKGFLANYFFNDEVVSWEREYFLLDEIFPLDTHEFNGRSFYIPGKTAPYLTKLYKDFMQPPPLEKRIIPHIRDFRKSTIPKRVAKDVLDRFYEYGYLNCNLGNKHKFNKLNIFKNFISFNLYLLVRLRFRSLRNLFIYSIYKIKKVHEI